MPTIVSRDVTLMVPEGNLYGTLSLPTGTTGIVVFAHGSGSSRFSPRNREVAAALHRASFGTMLFDLLTGEEDAIDQRTREHRFNIPLLADRLITATAWLRNRENTANLGIGYFGASTGAAAALIAAAEHPDTRAVVSRGGRPDLAGKALDRVRAPTLLIVGGRDEQVIELNRTAQQRLTGKSEMVIVPGATHLFEEPGAMRQVIWHAQNWFRMHLGRPRLN
jgi:putative phosphoribosyl transferase